MVRLAVCLTIACAACTPKHAPAAKTIGKVSAIVGVAGLIATAMVSRYTDGSTREIVFASSVLSGGGIVTYAIGELSQPPDGVEQETLSERHTRWARILTERAAGAAREGNCARVKRLQLRIRVYDAEVHDFVFMRDPEIQKCLLLPAPDAGPPELPADPVAPVLPASP